MPIIENGEFTFKVSSPKVLEEPRARELSLRKGWEQLGIKKYVRVSHDTPPEELYEMMRDEWNLSVPNLIISVTGGAKDFIMKPKLKNLFSKGLVKAAQTTGAWIITGGTHAGVMKLVGESVRDFTRSHSSYTDREIVVLGIAPWGIVYNRESMISKEHCLLAEYTLKEDMEGNLCSLDNNHSHFILVDDGSHGKYGVEIPLWTKLEKYISEQTVIKGDVNIKIPVVCVALEGGEGTLNTIHQSMNNNTPCVIVEDSGRVSDVIAEVAKKASVITILLIQNKLRCLFQEQFTEEKKIIRWTEMIQDIVRKRGLLTLFKADKYGTRAIDVSILYALLKACRSLGSKNWVYQLKLAVSWNRLKIAHDILDSEWQWEPKDLHPVMTVALIRNKPSFVQLFLDCGVNLREYVTLEIVTLLYNNIEKSSLIYSKRKKHLSEPLPNLKDISFYVAEMLGGNKKSFCPHLTSSSVEKINIELEPVSNLANLEFHIRDLLIWAVLQNRLELAKILWSQSQDCILGALACCKILRKLSKEVEEPDTLKGMQAHADHYEDLAMGVLSKCCRKHEENAEQLLTRVSFIWGKTTCLQMALNADAINFMSHGGVQVLLGKVWWGKLSVDNGLIPVLLCMLLFPLIFTGLVTFRGEQSRRLNCLQRLVDFFTAPVVVFFWNVISNIGLLWLFAYVVMMDFQVVPSWRECLIYVWIFSIFCEELRQSFDDPQGLGFVKKFNLYLSDHWNMLDVLALLLFSAGLMCRFTQPTFYAGRVILSLDFSIFCCRLMHIFAVSKNLGPKLIMMWRMVKDVCSFLFLLAVCIVSFGVATQAITVHNEERMSFIFRNVIYQPYLTLFGEFPSAEEGQTLNFTKCSLDGTDAAELSCPNYDSLENHLFPEWLTIVLLCLYLLFANILLVNLLIAIFSYTFAEVQARTDQIWRFQLHGLIDEYCSRPPLPPPLILFSHLYFLVKHVILRCRWPETESKQLMHLLDETDTCNLLSWEADCREGYLYIQQYEKSQSTDQKIRDTSEKVDKVLNLLEADQKKHMMTMETQFSEALTWMMKSMTEKGLGSKDAFPSFVTSPEGTTVPRVGATPDFTNDDNDQDRLYPESSLE